MLHLIFVVFSNPQVFWLCVVFFFSSRRRHTRFDCDWSSDVCSSDLPGPDFPPAVVPPDPNDQVGIIDGNSTGVVITEIDTRYDPGAEILAAVYSGIVQSIPDFAYTVPTTVTINTNQNRDNAISMNVTKNASFTGIVETSAFPDWGDAGHPWGTSLMPLA